MPRAAAALALSIPLLWLFPTPAPGQDSEAALIARARAIHERVITLDTHVDINPGNFTAERHYGTGLQTQVDLPKMESGGLDAAFLIVYVGQSADLTEVGFAQAHAAALEKFRAIHRLTDSLAPDRIGLARSAVDVRRIAASGRKVALIGVENGYSLGSDPANVRRFAELGARYVSLAHNGHNHLSDSNTGERDGVWLHGGLSPLGREMVRELNRWGVMIDVSHPSRASMLETVGLSTAPIIASHSAVRALCDHSRNLDDEQLRALARTGGVVQVVAFNGYVKCGPGSPERESALAALRTDFGLTSGSPAAVRELTDEQRMRYRDRIAELNTRYPPPPRATVKDFVDHIDYAVRLIGLDHVGISSDFDGGGGVDGWNSAAETFNVTLELVRRGYTEEQIGQLWSGNLLRVMEEVDRIGREIRAAESARQPADLVLSGARVWTGDSIRPWAEAVAITRDRITAVGTAAEMASLTGAGTQVIELPGRFISPGFIDNHTHFAQAGGLLLGVNLLDVADEVGLVRRVREARDRMPEGAWLVGGDWGAYEAWAQGSTGRDTTRVPAPFSPSRAMIDSITPDTPALLSKWDRSAYLANGKALALAGADCTWEGVECAADRPTGRLSDAAAARIRRVIPPKEMSQRLAEARMALDQLAGFGVTTIHDITGFDQLAVYQELRRRGELTTRIFARPTMDNVDRLLEMGILPGFGDEWVKVGGLKGFVDGIMGNSSARFYEPYLTSGRLGEWRVMMNPPGNMARLLKTADSAGYWPMVHAIGDHGIDTLLTMYEDVMRVNGPGLRARRFRVIHAQVLRGPEVADRMARLGLIAEVQPYHAIDDMRWMEQRIGERSRWAYAFRTLRDAGVLLSFGSDWPGTNAAWYTADPIIGMYAAVTRQTLDGAPPAGWFPEERVDLETALRAYTVNNAWAAGEEDLKGRVAPGLLADLAVWDRDPFGVSGAELKDRRIVLTILGGRIVHDAR